MVEPGTTLRFTYLRVQLLITLRVCSCSTDPKWKIRSPLISLTDTFFCLPNMCICRDGRREMIGLWVTVMDLRKFGF